MAGRGRGHARRHGAVVAAVVLVRRGCHHRRRQPVGDRHPTVAAEFRCRPWPLLPDDACVVVVGADQRVHRATAQCGGGRHRRCRTDRAGQAGRRSPTAWGAAVSFTVLPRTLWSAVEARSYALTTAIAVWLTVVLLIAAARRGCALWALY